MAEISKHTTRADWCHVCGNRSDHNAEVRYPPNAEHHCRPLPNYIRICRDCAEAIARVASSSVPIGEVRVNRAFGKARPRQDREHAIRSARMQHATLGRQIAAAESRGGRGEA